MYVMPRSPAPLISIEGKYELAKRPGLTSPDCVSVGAAPAVLTSYQRAWAANRPATVCEATKRSPRQAAFRMRESLVLKMPPGCSAGNGFRYSPTGTGNAVKV